MREEVASVQWMVWARFVCNSGRMVRRRIWLRVGDERVVDVFRCPFFPGNLKSVSRSLHSRSEDWKLWAACSRTARGS